jgi:hypothetical protein
MGEFLEEEVSIPQEADAFIGVSNDKVCVSSIGSNIDHSSDQTRISFKLHRFSKLKIRSLKTVAGNLILGRREEYSFFRSLAVVWEVVQFSRIPPPYIEGISWSNMKSHAKVFNRDDVRTAEVPSAGSR